MSDTSTPRRVIDQLRSTALAELPSLIVVLVLWGAAELILAVVGGVPR